MRRLMGLALGAALTMGAVGATVAGPVSAQERLTPEEGAALYGALPKTTRPDLSPDGRYLARRVVHDGRYALRIDPVNGGKARLWKPADGASLGRFAWTGDGDLLVISEKLAATRGRSLDPRSGRTRRYYVFFQEQRPQILTAEGKEVARLTFRRLGQIEAFTLLAEPELVSGSLPVFVDTENAGRNGEVFKPARFDLTSGRAEFGAPPVEGAGFFGYWGSQDGRVQLASRATFDGEVSYYARSVGSRWARLAADGLDDLTILAVLAPDRLVVGVPGRGVFAYDPAQGALGEALYEGADWAGLMWSDDRTEIVGVRLTRGVSFLSDEARGAHQRTERAVGQAAMPVDASHDGRVRIVATGGATPTRFHLVRDGEVIRSYGEHPALEDRQAAAVRTLTYEARDGLAIEAILSVPPGAAPGTSPLVVMPHGGPASRDTTDFDTWREYLVSLGFAVFQPNFRGSTGYGEAFAEAGKREWGAAMQTDIADGVRHLVAEGLAREDRLAIMGASYGGYAALMGTLDETPYACAVSINGVTDLLGMIDAEQTGSGFAYWNEHIGYRTLSEEELMRRSPLRRVGQIDVPVLLIHGVLDTTVLKGQSAAMETALKAAGGTVSALYLDESDHYLTVEGERQRALRAAGSFLKDCLSD